MSNYVPMPSPELREAIAWMREITEMQPWDSESSKNARTFLRELDVLIHGYTRFYEWERYQDFIRPRNELAQKIFVERCPKEWVLGTDETLSGDKASSLINNCLKLADLFLEVSGEKVKKAEEIKERLREVLGWKP
jgi:hypothetical protein